ncbi:MAG: pantoate--beta-alanine ligase [Phycisphaerae bacterium SG8_4]|nr:MAG: pantoate--beta-alanine ligase [Phycisphaerae bacterium SG8_4]
MEVAETIAQVRSLVGAARGRGKKVGLVPTMGALHTGHVSLIEAAVNDCDFVVVSIFVNPTQFGPGEDLEAYPKPFEADLEICAKAGVDLVFAPAPEQMYPAQNLAWVTVERLTEPLCGRGRPIHFRGVTTVCTKLFNIVGPDVAYFGQKDAQQATVVKRMVADLNMPLEIVVCPTVREPSGLAVSSRNQYLSDRQREEAANIHKSLEECRRLIEAGETQAARIIAKVRAKLQEVPSMEIEYVDVVDAETLESLEKVSGRVLVAVAVRIGAARLIDNIVLETGG